MNFLIYVEQIETPTASNSIQQNGATTTPIIESTNGQTNGQRDDRVGEEEIVVRRLAVVMDAGDDGAVINESGIIDNEEETDEATAALKEIRHVKKTGAAHNGNHSDMDDEEDDDDEYTDDDGGMDENAGANQMDSSMEQQKENEGEMSSALITDSSFNITGPDSGATPGSAKSKKKEDHEKLRRRLPVSVKELIDYHSSNGKSIKEIVAKVNVVCRPDEKVGSKIDQFFKQFPKIESIEIFTS